MDLAPQTTVAFDRLIATLQTVRDGYVLSTERFDDPLDTVEAYRYVIQLLSLVSELLCEADPERPRFVSVVDPARKFQGDNPDSIYHFCRIRGDGGYRISGKMDKECYTSFTVHGTAPDGGLAGELLGDVNDRMLELDDDGRYELILSAQRPAGARNWLMLDDKASSILVRSYFQLEQSIQLSPSIALDLRIDPLEARPPAPPLDDATFARRLTEAVDLLDQATLGQSIPGQGPPVPFVASTVNTLPVPFSFRSSGLAVPGGADMYYASGRWELAADEALVMSGRLPDAVFVNVMLFNRNMQTLDYRTRRTSMNRAQMTVGDDGSYRIVVAHADPGTPNWLDTEGHRRGTIFWRFLLPDEPPGAIGCEVVPLASLRPS